MGGLFKDVLKGDESLFIDELALDFDYVPKSIPYRENEQQYLATCIKPLFQGRSGNNLFITGKPGIGKTVAVKHVFRELEQETSDIVPIYINCWKKDTAFKLANEICEQIGYKWTHNKSTDELIKEISKILNRKAVVFCFDEIDRLKDSDILYTLMEDIYKKTILLITNEKEWLADLDMRIKSRLNLENLDFKPYNQEETKGILRQRRDHALVSGILEEEAFNLIVTRTFEVEDIRTGLFLLRESANIAESRASKKIYMDFVRDALLKLDRVKIKSSADLADSEKNVLHLIRNNEGKSVKDLYDIYLEDGGEKSYRTFYRKMKELKDGSFIDIQHIESEKGGKSTKVSYNKKLDEF